MLSEVVAKSNWTIREKGLVVVKGLRTAYDDIVVDFDVFLM